MDKFLTCEVKIKDMPLLEDFVGLLKKYIDDNRIPEKVKKEFSENFQELTKKYNLGIK